MNSGLHTESDRRRLRPSPTSHGSARESRRRRPLTERDPGRVARRHCSARPPDGRRATPTRDPTLRHPDTTADRLHPRTRGGRAASSPKGPKADETDDEQRTPHRIRPPPSQVTADLPRQRAREPKAPTPHRRPASGVGNPRLGLIHGLRITPRAPPTIGISLGVRTGGAARGASRNSASILLVLAPIHPGLHRGLCEPVSGPGRVRGCGRPAHQCARRRRSLHRMNDRSRRSRRTSASPGDTRASSPGRSSRIGPGVPDGLSSWLGTAAWAGARRRSASAGSPRRRRRRARAR